MKKLFLFAITIIMVGFISCEKQSDISDAVVGNYRVTLSRIYTDTFSEQTTIDTLPSYTIHINKQDPHRVGINNFIPSPYCGYFFIGQVSTSFIVLEQKETYSCTENRTMVIDREGDNLRFSYERVVPINNPPYAATATYSGIAIKD